MGSRESCNCNFEDGNDACCNRDARKVVHIEDFSINAAIEEQVSDVWRNSCDKDYRESMKEVLVVLEDMKGLGYLLGEGARDVITCQRIWEEFQADESNQLSVKEFTIWFRREVVGSRENLITLLRTSDLVKDMIRTFHDDSDITRDGKVDLKELTKALLTFYVALDEPTPEPQDIEQAAKDLMQDFDGDINGELDLQEFRRLFVHLMADIYFMHYSESMTNPGISVLRSRNGRPP